MGIRAVRDCRTYFLTNLPSKGFDEETSPEEIAQIIKKSE